MNIKKICYFARWKDRLIVESTSGGIAAAIAQKVIEDGGLVVGAAYDSDMSVRHVLVDDLIGLKRICGVKYVHSNVDKTVYDGVRTALLQNRAVAVFALPCQIAAMRKCFGEDKNLLLVDLVCFGAPQQLLWRKYVDWLNKKRSGSTIVDVNPRDKSLGWGHRTYWRYEWSDGRVERKLSIYDPYAQAFYSAIAFGSGCYRCPFKGYRTQADITLGDAWGYEKSGLRIAYAEKGLSCVVVHSEQGAQVLSRTYIESWPVDYEIIAENNFPIERHADMPETVHAFNADLKELDFGRLAKKYHLLHTRSEVFWSQLKSFCKCVAKRLIA